jgi:hypothetical protein
MKIKLLLCVILAGCAFGFAKSKGEVRDVTGCLSRGDSAKEYLLTGNDGSTWEVRSSRVALGKHVGHTVTATGVVSHSKMHNMKEDAKEAAKDSGPHPAWAEAQNRRPLPIWRLEYPHSLDCHRNRAVPQVRWQAS